MFSVKDEDEGFASGINNTASHFSGIQIRSLVLVIEIIEHFYKMASFRATNINGLPAFCKPAAVDFRRAMGRSEPSICCSSDSGH